ncbi:MAG: hypothetical protein V1678_01310 [Candidatus Aenigmatarchaeota archaeon]
MKLVALVVLIAVMAAGCTQTAPISSNQTLSYLKDSDVRILGTQWAFDDQCQYGKESVGYVNIECEKMLECEVYVNGIKSNYSAGFQPCEGQLVVAEKQTDQKSDFVAEQDGNYYYYTLRNKSKTIEICCSYVDALGIFNRDYEICQTTRLEAQCPDFSSNGFGNIIVLSWDLRHDGLMTLRLKNAGQDAVVRRIFVNDTDPSRTLYNTQISYGSQSQEFFVTGAPIGLAGESYGMKVSIEYYIGSKNDMFYNSTGELKGTYS